MKCNQENTLTQICDYVHDNNLKNPMLKFHYILFEKSEDFSVESLIENLQNNDANNIEWLVKNIQAHFYKLVNTVLNLLEFQNIQQEQNIKLKIDMEMTIVNLLEYFYIKKSTILDLLDIFYKSFFDVNKNKSQLEQLITVEMEQYLNSKVEHYAIFKNLHKNEILKIRNRIIHNEGFSIKSYIQDNEFLFQVYDSNLDEQINPILVFSYYSQSELAYKPPLIKVAEYVTFQLCSLYKYMDLYLEFLLSKKGFNKDTIDGFYQQIINSSEYIIYRKNDLSLLQKMFAKIDKKVQEF